jgi:hypothetical protein
MLLWSALTKYYIYISLFINLFEPMKIKNLSTDGVKNFKYMCSGYMWYIYGLVRLSSWLLLWFLICGLFQVLFLGLAVNF